MIKKIKIGPWIIFAAISSFMLFISWLKWPDVLIDFGRELYIPWAINNGAVLYRDITFYSGPISPYLNAILFRLFGTSLMTLVFFNITFIALILFLIYKIFCFTTNKVMATVAGVIFLSIFAFSQYLFTGNYNFVCPYSHNLTHGILLAFITLYVFSIYIKQKKIRWVLLTGILLGSIFLTKIEVFVAISFAIFPGIVVLFFMEKPSFKDILKRIFILCAAIIMPMVIFVAYLAFFMPIKEAMASIMVSCRAILNAGVSSSLFYQKVTGTHAILPNVIVMIKNTVFYLMIIVLTGAAAWAFRYVSIKEGRVKALAALILAGSALMFVFTRYIKWQVGIEGLPILLVLFLFYLLPAVIYMRSRGKKIIAGRYLMLFTTVMFSLALLSKIFFNVRICHYGFALAMPGTLILAAIFIYFIPKFLGRIFGNLAVMRNVLISAVAVILLSQIAIAKEVYDMKTYPVGNGADTIITFKPEISGEGVAINEALGQIRKNVPRESTFIVFPEGVMLNYLSRIRNPSPYIVFIPPDLSMFGEDVMLKNFKAGPPDYVILVDRDTSEYGYPAFGRDYGLNIYDWIVKNYSQVSVIGNPPLSGHGFGIAIRKRNK